MSAGAAVPLYRRPVVWAAAAMAVLGLVGPSWGPALVPARAHFHLGLTGAGTLFLVFGICRTAGAALTASISDRVPLRAAAAVYGATLVAALLVVASASRWSMVLAGAGGIGFAFGTIGTEANALAAAGRGAGTGATGGDGAGPWPPVPAARGRAVAHVNAAWSVGAACGPLAVGLLLAARLDWRVPFALWAVLAVVPVAGLVAVSPRVPEREGRAPLRADSRLLVLAAMAFVYNGVGWTVSGWAATYLAGRFGASVVTGALGSSVFYACIAAGQFGSAMLAGRVALGRQLRWQALGTASAMCALAFAPVPALAVGAFGAAGLALGGVYPNLVAYATALSPERPGAMSGLVSTGGAIGVGLVPFAAGALAGAAGVSAMAWLMLALGALLFAGAATLAAEPGPAGTRDAADRRRAAAAGPAGGRGRPRA